MTSTLLSQSSLTGAMAFLSARHERFLVSHSLLLFRSAAAARADHFVQHTAYLLRLKVRLNTEATLLSSYWPYCVVEKKGIHNNKKYLADLMHDFIRSPDAIAIGLSHVILLGDHGNAGATNEIKQGGSIFRCIRCIMPSYLWPHIMCYCPNFLERDNKTLVDNAEACTTSSLRNAAHSLRFHSQNGTCDIIPRDNPEMLLKAPAPLHDNIHMAVLFVTLLVVAIHRHHPELHQKRQFDAWLQRNNITNEVRKVMQKVAGKCRQMGIVPVSIAAIFSYSCSCLCCCELSDVHSCVTAAASLLMQQLLVLFLLLCDHYCLSSPAAQLLQLLLMKIILFCSKHPELTAKMIRRNQRLMSLLLTTTIQSKSLM